MVVPHQSLSYQAATCRLFPRERGFADPKYGGVQINLTGIQAHATYAGVVRAIESGDRGALIDESRRLVGRSPEETLVAGMLLLQARATDEAILVLSRAVPAAPVGELPFRDALITFSFDDETFIAFDANGLAGAALLVIAYATEQRYPDAIALARTLHEVAPCEGLLYLRFCLMRDKEMWEDILGQTNDGLSVDHPAIELIVGEALEGAGRLPEALECFESISVSRDTPSLWSRAAATKCEGLRSRGVTVASTSRPSDDEQAVRFQQKPRASIELKRAAFERDAGACAQCGRTDDLLFVIDGSGADVTVDHVRLLCDSCSSAEGATPDGGSNAQEA